LFEFPVTKTIENGVSAPFLIATGQGDELSGFVDCAMLMSTIDIHLIMIDKIRHPQSASESKYTSAYSTLQKFHSQRNHLYTISKHVRATGAHKQGQKENKFTKDPVENR
jgi:hypothetical protein